MDDLTCGAKSVLATFVQALLKLSIASIQFHELDMAGATLLEIHRLTALATMLYVSTRLAEIRLV
jgi:hypothetical protein